MTVQAGTIQSVSLVNANSAGVGTRKAYLLSLNFPAYTGAGDSMSIAGVGAAIASNIKNGKTNTLRSAICVGGGLDSASQAVYTGALTVSTDALTGNLTQADGTELTSSTASSGVLIVAVVDES